MLQCRSSNSELKCLALSLLSQETMDQTTGERVTTTHAVDDRVDVVVLALIELLTIIDKSLPAVMCSRVLCSQPPPHIQWPQMGYTTSEMAAEYTQ